MGVRWSFCGSGKNGTVILVACIVTVVNGFSAPLVLYERSGSHADLQQRRLEMILKCGAWTRDVRKCGFYM